MPNFTQATYDAREIAMARMQAEAERDGAEGIVGVRITEENSHLGRQAIEFLALGTSIRRLRAGPAPEPDRGPAAGVTDPAPDRRPSGGYSGSPSRGLSTHLRAKAGPS